MLHKFMEEWFDTILYIGMVTGLLLFFPNYWSNAYQYRYAKVILTDFLDETAIAGKITQETYEGLQQRLHAVYPEFCLEISCVEYRKQHVYKLRTEEEWREFFSAGNRKKEVDFQEYEPEIIQENPEELQYQQETNATVLAGKEEEYLPLPGEQSLCLVTAMRPEQEVYESENLITVCKIASSEGVYYQEAPVKTVEESGIVLLEPEVDGRAYPVPVTVICHSRTVLCGNGHTVVNTKSLIEERKATGSFSCPYCKLLPQSFSSEVSVLYLKTGEPLTPDKLKLRVLYQDGHSGYITPDSEDWQDNYDMNFCGTQEVTFCYRNKEFGITVVTENPVCTSCKNACNERSLADYLEFPYCFACLSEIYTDTGKEQVQEQTILGKELLEYLNVNGELLLERGDFAELVLISGETEIRLQREIKIDGRSGGG